MLVLNEHQFISNLEVMVGAAKNVVIASYGRIEGCPEGLSEQVTATGKHIRTVVGGGMFNGTYELSPFLSLNRDPRIEQIQSTKEAGVAMVSDRLSEVPESALIILYVGTSRLQRMVSLGAALAEKGARVVLFGCGCDDCTNFSHIDTLPYKESITVVIPESPKMTGVCDSGYSELGDVVERLLQ